MQPKPTKFFYYNDEHHGVALSIDDLHSSRLVPSKSFFIGEVQIEDDEIIWIKKWDKVVLIGKMKQDQAEKMQEPKDK